MDELPPRTDRTLNSWKEIASYLGRGVRTVQRWEEELRLPVHRIRETNRSPVFAFESDLQKWLEERRRAASPQEQSAPGLGLRASSSVHPRVRATAAISKSQRLTTRMAQLLAEQSITTQLLKQNMEAVVATLVRLRGGPAFAQVDQISIDSASARNQAARQ